MAYRKATYEEYCSASKFAKTRYKYGVFIQAIAAILLLFLVIYTVMNIEEMKAHPLQYAEEKLGIECIPTVDNVLVNYNHNGSNGDIRSIERGR